MYISFHNFALVQLPFFRKDFPLQHISKKEIFSVILPLNAIYNHSPLTFTWLLEELHK